MSTCFPFSRALALAPLVFALATPALRGEDDHPVVNGMRDVATPEELSAKFAAAVDPTAQWKQGQGKDPAKETKQPTLFDMSDFLCYNGIATLVPKGAVIHIPKALQDRFHYVEGADIKIWSDFFALNRAWISNIEITRQQAEGNTPISEDTLKSVSKSSVVVIATLQGGPISVLPPKKPAAAAGAAGTPTAAGAPAPAAAAQTPTSAVK